MTSKEKYSSQPSAGTRLADYSRQLRVHGMPNNAQQLLADASVLIIGAGGLGVTAMSYLAGAGIGNITVMDGDHIESSNLHRQTIYRYEDIGQNKAATAVHYLELRTANCTLTAINEHATLEKVSGWFPKVDVILDCTDDIYTSYMLNDLAWLHNKPVVFAKASGMQGQLFTLHPHAPDVDATATACYRCMWPEPPANGNTCDIVGVLGPVPGILGCLQAIETIKIITRLQHQLHNQLLQYDFSTHRQHNITVSRRKSCPHTRSAQEVSALHRTPAQYKNDLQQAAASGMRVIDIRSKQEIDAEPIPYVDQHLAMETLLDNAQMHLDKDMSYVLVCKTGARSKNAVRKLQSQFPNLYYYP